MCECECVCECVVVSGPCVSFVSLAIVSGSANCALLLLSCKLKYQAIGGSAMLVYMSPQLALLSLAVIPPVGIVGVLYGRYAKQRQKMVQAALGKTMEVTAQALLPSITSWQCKTLAC